MVSNFFCKRACTKNVGKGGVEEGGLGFLDRPQNIFDTFMGHEIFTSIYEPPNPWFFNFPIL